MTASPLLLVMAGGTGGHIFPGLAVANYLRNKGWKIHWLGSENGMEVEIVSKQNIEISLLPVKGVRGKGLFHKLLSPFIVLRSIWQARQYLKTISPDVVLGMGGFASGPGGVAARILNKPLVIHEQNAIAGYTNRLLSQVATEVLSAFPNAFVESIPAKVVGNPIRKDLCQLEEPQIRFSTRSGNLRVLVIGGSRGAQILNQVIPQALQQLDKIIELKLQCGKGNLTAVKALIDEQTENKHELEAVEFIDDMAEAFSWADIVICRAGALTVSELMAVGVGALFVPYPYAVDDHQTANAKFLKDKGGAEIIQQQNFNVETVAGWLQSMTRKQAQQMAIKAFDKKSHNVTKRIGKILEKLVKGTAS